MLFSGSSVYIEYILDQETHHFVLSNNHLRACFYAIKHINLLAEHLIHMSLRNVFIKFSDMIFSQFFHVCSGFFLMSQILF